MHALNIFTFITYVSTEQSLGSGSKIGPLFKSIIVEFCANHTAENRFFSKMNDTGSQTHYNEIETIVSKFRSLIWGSPIGKTTWFYFTLKFLIFK